MARWVDDRLVPKVVVATQSRVVEAAVDRRRQMGAVHAGDLGDRAPAERLDHVAAVLLGPPATAWALGRFTGAALATGAVKLAARQVLDDTAARPGPGVGRRRPAGGRAADRPPMPAQRRDAPDRRRASA